MTHQTLTHPIPALPLKTGLKAGACEPPDCGLCETKTQLKNCLAAADSCKPPDCNCSTQDSYLRCLDFDKAADIPRYTA
jgi:hypothetical protein